MDRSWEAGALAELLGTWAGADRPLYLALADAIQELAEAGDLAIGDRLPAERALAATLALSRSTVVAAYRELRRREVASSARGSGTTVRPAARTRPTTTDGRVAGGTAASIFERLVDEPAEVISLSRAMGTGSSAVRDALLDVAGADLPRLLADTGYHPHGLRELREAIAAHYGDGGLPTTAEQIVVTTGATQALGLAVRLFVRRGSTVIVEAPNWPGCLDVLREAGARLVGVRLDEEGMRIQELAEAIQRHRPDLVYLMPTFHNPTGTLMSAPRRRWIADLCARHGVPVVEDNAYCSTIGVEPPSPLAAFAPEGSTVVSVGSLTKTVWAGLRIGWARADADLVRRLARLKALADLGCPVIDQAVAARLLPRWDDLSREHAELLSRRLDLLRRLLSRRLPSWRWRDPDGGSALWIELPDTDAADFAHVALRHGVEVTAGAASEVAGDDDAAGAFGAWIRLPFTFAEDVLTEAVDRLATAWERMEAGKRA
ncbi:PLP-dependent aminotransferase family protein [Stackebrandtia nassauensis]|uniref:Transcriptional regulator, GntR family with aminotransferase domain protein n=1 Tax=Stackebrandtia nassauensis (strain DSM 44728 / CIP 108903 / NRRL B-16338 / NBRC 102104 / LLR-40K-21) TaxID=446470 RepID=D3Q290_STANL|nr:PLP-dependent aminotransferase family protein [Stackebrandtia nassauensis]ADD43823.1 transcriptional regulator, GntR family with aminotransferase domain protein [Stackebrandtia nassauensis DSM 44728]